jgi:hypothetical protein
VLIYFRVVETLLDPARHNFPNDRGKVPQQVSRPIADLAGPDRLRRMLSHFIIMGCTNASEKSITKPKALPQAKPEQIDFNVQTD